MFANCYCDYLYRGSRGFETNPEKISNVLADFVELKSFKERYNNSDFIPAKQKSNNNKSSHLHLIINSLNSPN
jgi:hypothetical protein